MKQVKLTENSPAGGYVHGAGGVAGLTGADVLGVPGGGVPSGAPGVTGLSEPAGPKSIRGER
jgi:hypothetical protein